MGSLFRDKATSVLAGFHAGPLFWLNWNLEMLVFAEGGLLENAKKNPLSKATTNNPYGTEPESNSGHIGGWKAPPPLRHPAPHQGKTFFRHTSKCRDSHLFRPEVAQAHR